MKYLITPILLVFTFSCTTSDWQPFSEKSYATFDLSVTPSLQEYTLVPSAHELFTDSLIFPGRMLVLGDHLIITENKGDYPFHIYDLTTNEYVRAGRFGQGPHELMIPWSLSPIDDNSFIVYDGIQRKVVAYDIQELIATGTSLWETKIEEQGSAGCPIYVDNSIYYLRDVSGDQRIYKLDLDTKKTSGYGVMPTKQNASIAEHVHSQAFQGLMTRQDDKLVVAYRWASFLETFDLETEDWLAFRGPDQFSPLFEQGNHDGFEMFVTGEDTHNAYIDLFGGKEYTYLLYDGEKLSERDFAVQGDILYLMDNTGNIAKQQQLEVDIATMAIYQDSLLFGLRYDIIPELVIYNLKEAPAIPTQEL